MNGFDGDQQLYIAKSQKKTHVSLYIDEVYNEHI